MAPVIVATKDETFGKSLINDHAFQHLITVGDTHYFARSNDANIETILNKKPGIRILDADLINTLKAQESGWGGEDYSLDYVPQKLAKQVEDELSALLSGLKVEGGARRKRSIPKRRTTKAKKQRGKAKKTRRSHN